MRAISCVAEVEFDWRVSAMDVGMCGIYGGIIANVVDTGVMSREIGFVREPLAYTCTGGRVLPV